MNSDLQTEADRASEMLSGHVVRIVRQHSPGEVMIEFDDGTRLYVNHTAEGLDLSITGDAGNSGVERVLAWYEKEEPGYQVATEELRGMTLSELRGMFNVSVDDPVDPLMYNCYAVKSHHVQRLQHCVRTEIDLARFSYFVEAYQRETQRVT